jgi:thymidine kinase
MANLYFRYSAMNAGKSTILLQTAHNYEERDHKAIIIKPSIDTKGGDTVVSRIGISRKVDELIDSNDSIISKLEKYLDKIDAILVDEAQFLTRSQVNELFLITKLYDIPVIAYGLRTNFMANSSGFAGSMRLLELADKLEEMPTICRCGKKARFNGRKINGEFVYSGDSVVIDGTLDIEYESLCGECYVEKVLKLDKEKVKKLKKVKNDFLEK